MTLFAVIASVHLSLFALLSVLMFTSIFFQFFQGLFVQRMDNFINHINPYPADKTWRVLNFDWIMGKFYPLDRNLSAG